MLSPSSKAEVAIGVSHKRTPLLLMNSLKLEEKALEFIGFAPKIKSYYAVKANSSLQILRLFREIGLGYEVSSIGELRQLSSIGISSNRIITSNPIKSPEFIRAAYRMGINRYVVDSFAEIGKIAADAPGSQVVVRVSTDNSRSIWPLDEKFGVDSDEALELLMRARKFGLTPFGLTFHVGSQCISLESWTIALSKIASLWRLAAKNRIILQELNLGGGFPASHHSGLPSLPEIIDHILKQTNSLLPRDISLSMEPGRSLVADAGVLVTSVVGKAVRDGQAWMYLDIGIFNGLMEAKGGIPYTFMPLGDIASREKEEWVLAGPSCDSFDVIGKRIRLPELEIGERIMIHPAGAYTTVYSSRFNGMKIPKVHFI